MDWCVLQPSTATFMECLRLMFSRFKKPENDAASQPQASGVQKSLLDAFVPATKSWPSSVANSNNGSFLNELTRAERPRDQPVYDNWQQSQGQSAGAPQNPQSVSTREPHPIEPVSSSAQTTQINDLVEKLSALKNRRSAPAEAHLAGVQAPNTDQVYSNHSANHAAAKRNMAQDQQQPMQSLLSFGAVIRRLLSAWWLILIMALIGMFLAAGYAVTLPNKYEAVAEILIEPRETVVLEGGVSPVGMNREATIAYAESQVRIISSSSVIDLVIEELELQEDPEFNGQGVSVTGVGRFVSMLFGKGKAEGDAVSNAKSYLYENFYVLRNNQTFTLQIGVTTADPQKSALIANTIARVYMSDESIARSTAARNANQDLSGRLGELQAQVRASEQAVEEYRAENGLIDAEGKLLSEVQLGRLSEQLALAKVQVGDARTKAEQARRTDLADVVSGSVPSSLATNTVSQLRVQYSRARGQLAKVSTKLGARHPERIGAQSELNSARNALAQEMRRIVASAQDDLKRAQARQADLQEQFNVMKSSAVTDNSAKVKLRELSSKLEANRKIYEMVLLRSRETGEQEIIQPKTARIISSAEAPEKKTGPNRKLIVAGGALTGGALGGFLALLPLLFGATRALVNNSGTPAPMAPVQRHYQDRPTDDLYGNPVAAPNQPQQHAMAMPLERAQEPAERPHAAQSVHASEPAPVAKQAAPQPQTVHPQMMQQPMMHPQPVQMQMPLMQYPPQMMGYPMQQQPMMQPPMMQPMYMQAPSMVPQPMPVAMYPWATSEPQKKS